jgi:hypothetical protein
LCIHTNKKAASPLESRRIIRKTQDQHPECFFKHHISPLAKWRTAPLQDISRNRYFAYIKIVKAD